MDWNSRLNKLFREHAGALRPDHPLRRCLAQAWDYYLGRRTRTIELEIQGTRLKLHPLLRSLDTQYEHCALSSFLSRLKPGDVVWDFGAHVGIYSMLSSLKVGRRGKVFAWEPSPDAFQVLKDHLLANNLNERVFCVNEAVGEVCGTELAFRMAENLFNGGEMNRVGAGVGATTSSIPIKTIDHWAARLEVSPDYIKMDIEGSEGLALRGAKSLLSRKGKRPAILMSLHPRFLSELNDSPENLQGYLGDLGYAIYDLSGRRCALENVQEYWLLPTP